jgi:hypothetical protein
MTCMLILQEALGFRALGAVVSGFAVSSEVKTHGGEARERSGRPEGRVNAR